MITYNLLEKFFILLEKLFTSISYQIYVSIWYTVHLFRTLQKLQFWQCCLSPSLTSTITSKCFADYAKDNISAAKLLLQLEACRKFWGSSFYRYGSWHCSWSRIFKAHWSRYAIVILYIHVFLLLMYYDIQSVYMHHIYTYIQGCVLSSCMPIFMSQPWHQALYHRSCFPSQLRGPASRQSIHTLKFCAKCVLSCWIISREILTE